jgi:hypothetical protein
MTEKIARPSCIQSSYQLSDNPRNLLTPIGILHPNLQFFVRIGDCGGREEGGDRNKSILRTFYLVFLLNNDQSIIAM